MKRKIFIIGNSAKESALARTLSSEYDVFVAPGNDGIKQYAEIVDIREDNVIELLNFAMENDIFFTIVCSNNSIKQNIEDLFNQHGLMIFSPGAEAAKFAISKSTGKKLFYKLRLPTPRFAVYEKKNLAIDYVKNCDMPVVIKTDEQKTKNSVMVCPSFNIAKSFIEDCFFNGENKVIIEEYVYGTPFSFYVISDGYKALPIGSTQDYKYSLEGNGGIWTEGMGASAPFIKLSFDHEDYIMNEIVYPIVNYMSENLTPYMGILGFDGIITPEGDIAVSECRTFLQDHDADCILSLLDENIFKLMHACVIGSFSDEYDIIDIKDEYAVSCVLSCGQTKGNVISGLDNLLEETLVGHINTKQNEYTEYETLGDRTLVITTTAKTMSRAMDKLSEEIDTIDFRGKTYRKDICKIPIYN